LKKLVVILGLVLVACTQHDDLLPPIDVTEPPTPANLTVSTTDFVIYHLSWQIDDPSSVVKEYRVYSMVTGYAPVLQGTTDTTAVEINAKVPVLGVSFCVSTVTVDNVEGHLVCAAPE
jgi:hypothetical protein